MKDNVYLDTSALAKWYINEKNSEKFANFIAKIDIAVISGLTKVEMRSLIAKRRRLKEITADLEMQVFSTLENDIEQGFLQVYSFDESVFERAVHLLTSLQPIPLRTLDTLHLAFMQSHKINTLATADTTMAKAAKAMGLTVANF